jgi:hypothetical protein
MAERQAQFDFASIEKHQAAMLDGEDPLLISQSLTYVTDDGETLHSFNSAPLSTGKSRAKHCFSVSSTSTVCVRVRNRTLRSRSFILHPSSFIVSYRLQDPVCSLGDHLLGLDDCCYPHRRTRNGGWCLPYQFTCASILLVQPHSIGRCHGRRNASILDRKH